MKVTPIQVSLFYFFLQEKTDLERESTRLRSKLNQIHQDNENKSKKLVKIAEELEKKTKELVSIQEISANQTNLAEG